ncbi:MAG: hypothetical protein ACMVY4_10680 [Minwuia sp.]|uniref:hypothetical protein n=1 Tax=Minwuia sp. TaxID=2493630 RepID=UPI003A86CB52
MTPLPIDHVELDRILNQLRTLAGGERCPAVLFTGATRGAGASTLAWAVAQRAVMSGQRVLFVDLDPLKPYTEQVLFLDLETGPQPLEGVLTAPKTIPGRTLDVTRIRSWAGARRSGQKDGSLLAAELETLGASYDLIVADGAPVAARRTSATVDGCAVTALFDVTYLAVAGAVTSAARLQAATDRLTEMGGRIAGTVLNEREMELPFQGLSRRFRQLSALLPWLPRLLGFRFRSVG